MSAPRGAVDVLFEPLARDAGDAGHCGGAVCDQRAPGRIVQRLRDEGAASGGDTLDRIVQRQAARLQEFVEFARQFIGDDALQLGEAVEVHIESALRDAGGADQVIHRHLIEGARRIKLARAAATRHGVRALRSRPICARRARSILAICLSRSIFHVDYKVIMTI